MVCVPGAYTTSDYMVIKKGDFVILRKDITAYEVGKCCYNEVYFKKNTLQIIKKVRLAMKWQAVFDVEWADEEDALIVAVDDLGKDVPQYIPAKFLENPFYERGTFAVSDFDESAPD